VLRCIVGVLQCFGICSGVLQRVAACCCVLQIVGQDVNGMSKGQIRGVCCSVMECAWQCVAPCCTEL